jgi:hypothetical protein
MIERTLTVTFDVTGLSEAEVNALDGYVHAQSEGGNDGEYPAVSIVSSNVAPEFPEVPKRTILVHLNVEVPVTDERNADEVGDFVLSALEVGLEGAPGDLASGNIVTLKGMEICAPLVDEV